FRGELLFGGTGFLLLQHLRDRILHIGKRLGAGCLLLFRLDDVIAKLRADDAGGLPGRERHRRLCVGWVKTGGGVHTQLAALVLTAGVVRVLLREVGEVAAGLQLVQHVLRLGFGVGIGLRIRARCNGDEDVAGVYLLIGFVVGLMVVVVGLNLSVRNLGLAAGQLRCVEGDVFDLARFRNGVFVAGGVLLEKGLQIGVGRVDGFLDVLERDYRVVELHFGAGDTIGVAHRLVGDRDTAGDE